MTGETLRDRDVLGVERQEPRPGAARLLEHERPAGDEHLLVRERHVASEPQRRDHRLEPDAADQRPDQEVGVVSRGLEQAFAAADDAQLRIADRVAHGGRVLGARDRDELGAELLALLHEQIDGAPGRERRDPQLVREARRDVERLGADRARRAEHAEPLHDSVSRACTGVRPKRRSRCW